MRWVCVFAGSSDGVDPRWEAPAAELGRAVAEAGWGLVFGGTDMGLMAVVARAARDAGAPVVGVMPRFMRERGIPAVDGIELDVAADMHQRKARMYERADAVVALPGGVGTLDELCEVLAWRALGLLDVPVGLVDVAGWWGPLLALLHRAADAGMVRSDRLGLVVHPDPRQVLRGLGVPVP